MRAVKFTDLITLSIERAGVVLFKPFSAKKWLKFFLIACLAGAIPGGGFGGGTGSHSAKKADASPVIVRQQTPSDDASAAQTARPRHPQKTKERFNQQFDDMIARFMLLPAAVMAAVIFVVTAIVLALTILFMWLGARFRFIWFEAIVHNRDAIRAPFALYKKEGDSIFKLSLVILFGFLMLIGILAAWVTATLVAVNFFKTGWAQAGGAIASLALAFGFFFAASIMLALWGMCVEHFVITIMATDRINFRRAWRKFWPIYQKNVKDFWLYLLIVMGLGIVTSIIEGVIFVIVLLVFALAAFIIFGLAYVLFAVLLQAKALFWAVALVLAIPTGLAALAVIAAVGLPFAVFFRNFSLYFFSSINCGYVPLPLFNPKEGA